MKAKAITKIDLTADRAHVLAKQNVSRETTSRLDGLVNLFLKWQATTNLVADSTLPQLWTRHVADSLQLLKLAPEAQTWVDLGSGGGFPGLVIACVLAPRSAVHLVESNMKKAAFLREAARITGAPATIHAERIEDFLQHFQIVPDVVTARALAPLEKLLEYVAPFVEKGAKALLLKGQDVEGELTQASKYWRIDAELVPSETDTKGRIVVLRSLQRLA
ncbi:MAG: 16S rRNA (guanine(527)-N(7))-methyltransferase RsmG [Xanthobacteraceae bacterium]